MHKLEGQRILIVGASSGIGLATAKMAASAGARVIMVSRSAEKLEAAAARIPAKVETRAVDMLSETAVSGLFAALDPVDHVILTAVADENARRGRISEISAENMERSLDKFRGFFFIVRSAASKLAPRGSITLTSGGSALKPPREGMSVLAGVNAAIAAFSHALALELAPVRVNSLTPGVVDTQVWNPESRTKIKAWAESPQLPAQRFGQPDDIAEAMLFLMTNPYVTGHNLVVDGGLVAT